MSRLVEKPTMWFPNRSDTNRAVQLQKQARSIKFWSKVEEELYYPSSENKGADQLREISYGFQVIERARNCMKNNQREITPKI